MTVFFEKMPVAIRERRDRPLAMISNIDDAVIATYTAEVITFLNRRAAHLIGWAQENDLGKPL